EGVGNTALHLAVINWQNLLIRVLLDASANTNIANSAGDTPLMLSVNAGNLQAMQLLLDAGAKVDFEQEKGGDDFNSDVAPRSGSVLLRAVQRQVLCELVEVIIEAKAKTDVADEDANRPLHLAIQNGDSRVTRLLLESRADPDTTNRSGRTATHIAAATGAVRIVRILAEHRADVNIKDNAEVSPLQIANSSTQRLLREMGAQDSRPSTSMGLAEGAEWAGGPKGGGVYPAGRFRVEEIPEQ
ncbi:Ankrd44, partial [Symbiodinium sp. KB8]